MGRFSREVTKERPHYVASEQEVDPARIGASFVVGALNSVLVLEPLALSDLYGDQEGAAITKEQIEKRVQLEPDSDWVKVLERWQELEDMEIGRPIGPELNMKRKNKLTPLVTSVTTVLGYHPGDEENMAYAIACELLGEKYVKSSRKVRDSVDKDAFALASDALTPMVNATVGKDVKGLRDRVFLIACVIAEKGALGKGKTLEVGVDDNSRITDEELNVTFALAKIARVFSQAYLDGRQVEKAEIKEYLDIALKTNLEYEEERLKYVLSRKYVGQIAYDTWLAGEGRSIIEAAKKDDRAEFAKLRIDPGELDKLVRKQMPPEMYFDWSKLSRTRKGDDWMSAEEIVNLRAQRLQHLDDVTRGREIARKEQLDREVQGLE